MAIITVIKEVKDIHKYELVIVKIGNFCHCYGRDAYVLSYLLGYKIKKTKDNYYMCGFPIQTMPKVENTLERKKINHMVLDRRNNYDVDEFEDYKNLNTYQETYQKAKKYIKNRNAIEEINKYLIKNINQKDIEEKIKKIKNIIEGSK